jgi:hypothetical protein
MSPMLAALRRFRSLAFCLLAFSPGVLGTVLPVLHPCPVDSPTMAHAAPHGPALGEPAHHAPGHSGEHGKTCHCPGTCHAASLVSPTVAALAPVRVRLVDSGAAPAPDLRLPAGRPFRLLPPSTAPPASV